MFVRKKTKLRIAYGLLAITALSVIAYDADARTHLNLQGTMAEHARVREQAAPLPILPLAQSPFRDAQPDASVASNESQPARSAVEHAVPSDVFYLKVAVQVDSGGGPVSFNRGTRVRLVREQGGKFLVTRNGTDFLIEKSQVTDDLTALAALARNSS
jgi:hypothetical protein